MIVLDLPRPPGVNNLFFNRKGKGRVKTAAYRCWCEDAGWRLRGARPEPIEGPVSVDITLGADGRDRDLDGALKAPIDLLVTHQLIAGDGREVVREIHARWSSEIVGCRVTVQPFCPADGPLKIQPGGKVKCST